MEPRRDRPVVAVAGATGFVGKALLEALVPDHRVIGLTRSPTRAAQHDDRIEWRHCDLFSLVDVERALEGADVAIYLVHSMLPNARLTQASFVDLDVLLADNFARAAERNDVRQIIYLGGIRPRNEEGAEDDSPTETREMSRHLASRLEVEATLAARSTPTTALRAGLVVGAGGSSMRVLVNLVRRLPAMILPAWTSSMSAPVAIDDVVRAVLRCLNDPATFDRHFDVGGPEAMSYREMMERTAAVLDVRRPMLPVPVFSPALSTHWVAAVAGAPKALVGPLIESLEHSVLPAPNGLQDWLVATGARPFDDALRAAIDEDGRPVQNPRARLVRSDEAKLREARTVRSVQRLPCPEGAGAEWVAAEYMRWLPRFMWPWLRVDVEGDRIAFRVRLIGLVLLQLTYAAAQSCTDRQLLHVTGGALAHVDDDYCGRLEFREVLGGKAIIAAIHDFRPRLPWWLYNLTQAIAHLLVMTAFGLHLRRNHDVDAPKGLLPRGPSSTSPRDLDELVPPAPSDPPLTPQSSPSSRS